MKNIIEKTEMKLKQTCATWMPEREAKKRAKGVLDKINYWEKDKKVFVSLENFWIDINLKDKSYCIGDYEG